MATGVTWRHLIYDREIVIVLGKKCAFFYAGMFFIECEVTNGGHGKFVFNHRFDGN